jgi:histone acetyltransferase (RNA polymerase elongator complex component)
MKSHSHTNVAVFIPHAGCRHACSFCDQRAISGQITPVLPNDVAAVLTRQLPFLKQSGKTAEIAFFGGTFTAIPRDYMIALLETAAEYLQKYPDVYTGIRCSTRPDCVDRDVLAVLRHYGTTAVEIGAQSMVDAVLRLNSRGHTADDVRAACALVKDFGFELGLQMMTGLPGDSLEAALVTADEIVKLKPQTARIYPTVVLPGTQLAEWYADGSYNPDIIFNEEATIELCAEIYGRFVENNIRVIRIGLNQAAKLKDSIIAGVWRDTFGEQVISRYYYHRVIHAAGQNGTRLKIIAPRRMTSKIVGYKAENKAKWAAAGLDIEYDFSDENDGDICILRH